MRCAVGCCSVSAVCGSVLPCAAVRCPRYPSLIFMCVSHSHVSHLFVARIPMCRTYPYVFQSFLRVPIKNWVFIFRKYCYCFAKQFFTSSLTKLSQKNILALALSRALALSLIFSSRCLCGMPRIFAKCTARVCSVWASIISVPLVFCVLDSRIHKCIYRYI